jgi:hypothetical protein
MMKTETNREHKMKLLFTHSYGESEYGLVYQNEQGLYEVYEVPQYGGEEQYLDTYHSLDDAVQAAKSFYCRVCK